MCSMIAEAILAAATAVVRMTRFFSGAMGISKVSFFAADIDWKSCSPIG